MFCLDILFFIFFVEQKLKFFDGLKFYFYGDFFKGYKEDFQNLVKVVGGMILKIEDEFIVESSNNVSDSD